MTKRDAAFVTVAILQLVFKLAVLIGGWGLLFYGIALDKSSLHLILGAAVLILSHELSQIREAVSEPRRS